MRIIKQSSTNRKKLNYSQNSSPQTKSVSGDASTTSNSKDKSHKLERDKTVGQERGIPSPYNKFPHRCHFCGRPCNPDNPKIFHIFCLRMYGYEDFKVCTECRQSLMEQLGDEYLLLMFKGDFQWIF